MMPPSARVARRSFAMAISSVIAALPRSGGAIRRPQTPAPTASRICRAFALNRASRRERMFAALNKSRDQVFERRAPAPRRRDKGRFAALLPLANHGREGHKPIARPRSGIVAARIEAADYPGKACRLRKQSSRVARSAWRPRFSALWQLTLRRSAIGFWRTARAGLTTACRCKKASRKARREARRGRLLIERDGAEATG